MKKYIYIDYENMSNLKNLPAGEDRTYFFFIGAEQKRILKDLVLDSMKVSVEWVDIEGQGKNALDFHIAYYIAKKDAENNVQHFILSKDKGFDPLISHINKEKSYNIVQRIITLDEIQENEKDKELKTNTKDIDQKIEKALNNLKSVQSTKRPKSEKALKAHIQVLSRKENWNDEEIQKIINELYRNKNISKSSNNRISYNI